MKKNFQLVKGVWKLFVLFLLILLTFSYAMFQGGFVSWFLFYSCLPFILYALCLAFYSLDGFTIERQLTRWEYNANESLLMKVILKRNSSFPLLFMIAEDCLSKPLAASVDQKKHKNFLFPGFQKEFSFEYWIEKLPRGEHALPAVRMLTSDPFGLIEKVKHIKTNEKILVYPAYEEIMSRPFENYFDQGMNVSKDRVQRDASMAIGIREYQPGDRFAWINWKASAKRNEMMIKEFEQYQSHDVFMIMDCAPDRRFETIVSFTASLGRAVLRKGARMGFFSASDERATFPLQSGETCQRQLFYLLAKSKDNSPVSFDKVLSTETFLLQQNVNFMLVTAILSTSLIDLISRFTARKCPVTIFHMKSEQDSVTSSELSIKALAQAQGIRVIFVHEGQFSTGLMEVING